jgi:hypothetical protein
MSLDLVLETKKSGMEEERTTITVKRIFMPVQEQENKTIPTSPPTNNEGVKQISGIDFFKKLNVPQTPKLGEKELEAVKNLKEVLPRAARKDGALNVADIPQIVGDLLQDPKVQAEINQKIADEVAKKRSAIHSKPPIALAEKLPLFGKAVGSQVDNLITDYTKRHHAEHLQIGQSTAAALITDQLSQLFSQHGREPKTIQNSSLQKDEAHLPITKQDLETLAASFATIYNWQAKARLSVGGSFGHMGAQTERIFSNGFSADTLRILENPIVGISYKPEGSFDVGFVPMKSTLRYASNNDLKSYGFSDSSIKALRENEQLSSNYYITPNGALIRTSTEKKSGAVVSEKLIALNSNETPLSPDNKRNVAWAKLDEKNFEDKMLALQADLLDINHSGKVHTRLTLAPTGKFLAFNNGSNWEEFKFEDGKQLLKHNSGSKDSEVLVKDETSPTGYRNPNEKELVELRVWQNYQAWVSSRGEKIKAEEVCLNSCDNKYDYDFYSFGSNETGGVKIIAKGNKDLNKDKYYLVCNQQLVELWTQANPIYSQVSPQYFASTVTNTEIGLVDTLASKKEPPPRIAEKPQKSVK